VNVKPLLVGVTVYEPFARPVKVYPPEASAVTVAVAAPVNATVAPGPPAPLIVPEIVKVPVVLKFAVPFAPLTVTAWFAGVNVKPVLVGVTVYEPFAMPEKA
jgi:hypothetical protein